MLTTLFPGPHPALIIFIERGIFPSSWSCTSRASSSARRSRSRRSRLTRSSHWIG